MNFFSLTLLAFFCSTFGFPATTNTDWSLITSLLQEIEGTVQSSLLQIYGLANAENPAVARNITDELEEVGTEGKKLLDEILREVEKEDLTLEEAREGLDSIQEIVDNLKDNIEEEIQALSRPTRNQIKATIRILSNSVKHVAHQIFAALKDQSSPTTTEEEDATTTREPETEVLYLVNVQ